MKKIIITGSAGFIGFHLALKLLKKKKYIIGIDNLNKYYNPKLKQQRLKILNRFKNFKFIKSDIRNYKKLNIIFKKFRPDCVVNLAAQAGVRYSIQNPREYLNTNIVGFFNIMELSKKFKIKHLVYASTSSVYGLNFKQPFSEAHTADHPTQFYAATKRSNEIMAHSYSYLYGLPTTGLRFFTVYGPWGRPDMALFKFVNKIINNKSIDVYNYGNHKRDFTYIDDITDGICKSINKIPKNLKRKKNMNPSISTGPFQIYNIGNDKPLNLMKYIKIIENILGQKAKINFLPLQQGDMVNTRASLHKIKRNLKYNPKTSIVNGIRNFINWYKLYYKKN